MTVEKFIKTHTFKYDSTKTDYIGMNQSALEESLKTFAELKCKELLEIVANLAEVNVLGYNDYEVDKDSILNAVDLKEFIK
jgi:hypothetical protein